MFLTPCTGLWCVPHPMYWCMVCSSPHVLVYGVFLIPCTGLWCVPHLMYWSMVCSSSHVLVYGVFLIPCTDLWCVPHPMYWCMMCSTPHALVYGVFIPCTQFIMLLLSFTIFLIIRCSTLSKKASSPSIPCIRNKRPLHAVSKDKESCL